MKLISVLIISILPAFAFCQDPTPTPTQTDKSQTAQPVPPTVTISAKGSDVRGVIHDLCTQAKKSYVLQPGINFALFLSLENVDFEEALNIVCAQAKLQFEIQNGIYFISKAKAVITPATPPPALGPLPKTVLDRTLTIHLLKTEIKTVFEEMGKLTSIKIEVDSTVPAYKLDAVLTKISLKGALDKITQATGLKYKFTNNKSLMIFKPEDPNKVSISADKG